MSSILLRSYLAATAIAVPLARRHLVKRLARGKEDPARVTEKQGVASANRPNGILVWLHAVGVGEVLALPVLARALMDARPGLNVLITSSSRTSAEALTPNLPDGVIHQYLPLDVGPWRRRFLDHWKPDLSVWAERDLWPGFILECSRRGIPLALVNARMDKASFEKKSKAGGVYRELLSHFKIVEAQDPDTARNLEALGANEAQVTGSLKTASAPLADQPETRAKIEAFLEGRRTWLAASTHPDEEPFIAEAHRLLLDIDPDAVLVLAPRDPARAKAAADLLCASGIDAEVLPPDNIPARQAQCHVLARIGQLGVWYRVAPIAFVGGSLDRTGGHNPWEAARLDSAILHGPNTANFAADYTALQAIGATRQVADAPSMARALADPMTLSMRERAKDLAVKNSNLPGEMAERLLAVLEAT